MKKAIITQTNYIPWKGFFDSIRAVDVFVTYDEMQYTKRDWRNRNMIKTPQGPVWMSIPVEVKGKFFQKINETRIADKSWTKNHLDLLKQNYRNAAHFKEMISWIEPMYMNCNYEYLTEVNLHFINEINNFLGIKTQILHSSDFKLNEERTQRLVDICNELGVSDYYSGSAAKAYMNEELFDNKKINVHYWDYSGYPEYPQLNGEFTHAVSVLDLIFNTGTGALNYLKSL